nr:hypothetical protein GCM10020093_010740 [Planobispora longispora]
MLPETHPPRLRTGAGPGAVLRSLATVIRNRTFAALALTAAFASGAMFCYISGASFVLQEVYGLSRRASACCSASTRPA